LHAYRHRQRCSYHNGADDTYNSSLSRTLLTVFLDRDGVLNRKMPEDRYVTLWSEFHPLPGVSEAITRHNPTGLRIVFVSNQCSIALGLVKSPVTDTNLYRTLGLEKYFHFAMVVHGTSQQFN